MGHLRPIEATYTQEDVDAARAQAIPPAKIRGKGAWKTVDGIVDTKHPNHTYDVTVPGRSHPFTELHCIIPGVDLYQSQGCTIGFFENQPDLAMIIAAKLVGRHPSTTIIRTLSGDWPQTWGQASHSAQGTGLCASVIADYPGEVAYNYYAGEPDYGRTRGICFGRTGELWILYLQTGTGGYRYIRVEVLTTAFVLLNSVAVEIPVGDDRALTLGYPDSSVFYDYAADMLTFLTVRESHTVNQSAKIWTFRKTSNGRMDYYATAIPPNFAGTGSSLENANMVGKTLFLGNFDNATNRVRVYSRDNGLRWSLTWQLAVSDFTSGTGGGTDDSNGTNYSPAYYDGSFFVPVASTVASVIPGAHTHYESAAIKELDILATNGSYSEATLYAASAFDRGTAVKLESVIDVYSAYYELAGDTVHTTDTRYGWYSGGGTVGEAPYTHTVDKEWLGPLYTNYSWDMDTLGASIGVNATLTSYLIGNPGTTFYLYDNIGIGPVTPCCPMRNPNNATTQARYFWAGEGDNTGAPNTRGVVDSECNRYYAFLRPTPYITPSPGNTRKTKTVTPTANVASAACGVGTPYGTCGINSTGGLQWFTGVKDEFTKAGYQPEIRWAYETVFCKVSVAGAVTTSVPIAQYTNAVWTDPTTGAFDLAITESIPIPENVWQAIPVEHLGLVAWVVDERDSPSHDPAPCIVVTDTDLTEIYRIPSSAHYSHEMSTPFATDQSYSGTIWARAGQYEYSLHGHDDTGPQCKMVRDSAGDTYLLCGFEAIKRVEPSTGTAGDTRNVTAIYKLHADHYEGISTGTASNGWTYPTITTESDRRAGPNLIRATAIGTSSIVSGCGDTDLDAAVIRQV